MELNFIFGDIKSQLDELTKEAKKIDDKKLLKEDDYSYLKPF